LVAVVVADLEVGAFSFVLRSFLRSDRPSEAGALECRSPPAVGRLDATLQPESVSPLIGPNSTALGFLLTPALAVFISSFNSSWPAPPARAMIRHKGVRSWRKRPKR